MARSAAAFLAALAVAGLAAWALLAANVPELIALVAGWAVFFVAAAVLQRRVHH